jgi:hypothetical protein
MQHLRDLRVSALYLGHQYHIDLLLESALLQKTTARSSLAGSPSTSCSCTAKRYKWPMCSGPKSPWKALYNKVLSMLK